MGYSPIQCMCLLNDEVFDIKYAAIKRALLLEGMF